MTMGVSAGPEASGVSGAGRATRQPRSEQFKLTMIAVAVVAISFCLFLGRPFSVISDIGYQAFSARQYVAHLAPFNSLRLVNPRDLSKDLLAPLTNWSPSWTALYALAFRMGLSAGKAGRLLALLCSLTGAAGWVRVVRMSGLKGRWRIVAIVVAALYCLRVGSVTRTGAGDQIVYAVAPWLIIAAAPLSVPFRDPARRRLIVQTTLLCLALGSVYWLKYSGIFLSLAILATVLFEQFRGLVRTRIVSVILLGALYGTAFVVPILRLKAYNYSRSGSDFIESSARSSPPRDLTRLTHILADTAYYVSPTLFSAASGAERISETDQSVRSWVVRVPGLVLLLVFFYLMARQPPGYLRNLTILTGLIPLAAIPALSFLGGAQFNFAMSRLCEPYWILLEIQIFWLWSQPQDRRSAVYRNARILLGLATAFQLALLLWIPYDAAKEALKIVRTPAYQTGAEDLWDTDLSKYGTRDIEERVKSLIHSPHDVIVPATYSDRSFATDTMLEFGGRLLPLSPGFVPLRETHGKGGANYFSDTPFVSSEPLRVILVTADPYSWDGFQESVRRVMRRFTQVREWTPGPPDPHGRTHIWVGQILAEKVN
jgi:hypothetical protein